MAAKARQDNEDNYVSGEEYQAMSRQAPRKITLSTHSLALTAGVLVLCLLSFVAGVGYQKHHGTSGKTVVSTVNGSGGRPGFGGRRGAGLGQVTAVSATSITVQSQRTGTSTTYSISSSTTITDNGQAVDASDIKTGDTVLVMASTTDSTAASRILVNPSFGGGFGGPAGGQGTSATPDTSGSNSTQTN